jgi:hypothetical protein
MSNNSNHRIRFRNNQRIAYLIPFLVVGLSYSQISLHGVPAYIGQGVCTLGLLGCVARIGLNARAARKA